MKFQEIELCPLPDDILNEMDSSSHDIGGYNKFLMRQPLVVISELLTRPAVWNNIVSHLQLLFFKLLFDL